MSEIFGHERFLQWRGLPITLLISTLPKALFQKSIAAAQDGCCDEVPASIVSEKLPNQLAGGWCYATKNFFENSL
jgi:hypothetical protein